MHIVRLTLLMLACLFVRPSSSFACLAPGPSPDDLAPIIAGADVAFIGDVESEDNNVVTFTVEKAFKGVKDGARYSATLGQFGLDCLRPSIGELWFYFLDPTINSRQYPGHFPIPAGAGANQGGFIVRNQHGGYAEQMAGAIKDKLGYDVKRKKSTKASSR